MDFSQYVNKLEAVFDEAVIAGNDDELFASGYLRGHFDLVVAQLELAEGVSDTHAQQRLLPELAAALDATRSELKPQDQQHVQAMLARLQQRAASSSV